VVLMLSRLVIFLNELENGTRLQIHTRSCIPHGVYFIRILILATLQCPPPALRGARGLSADTVLSVGIAQRFGLIPLIRNPNGSPKVSEFGKLTVDWNSSESLVCEGSMRAETD
jgi:hypothetical protein